MHVRQGEKQQAWFRGERYYHTPEGWWFSTREHTELGPFGTEKDAVNEVCFYIRQMNTFDCHLH